MTAPLCSIVRLTALSCARRTPMSWARFCSTPLNRRLSQAHAVRFHNIHKTRLRSRGVIVTPVDRHGRSSR